MSKACSPLQSVVQVLLTVGKPQSNWCSAVICWCCIKNPAENRAQILLTKSVCWEGEAQGGLDQA